MYIYIYMVNAPMVVEKVFKSNCRDIFMESLRVSQMAFKTSLKKGFGDIRFSLVRRPRKKSLLKHSHESLPTIIKITVQHQTWAWIPLRDWFLGIL